MEKKKMKIWKKLLIALGVIIALLAIVFIGYKLYDYMDKETRFKEFEKRDYVKTEGTLSYAGDNTSKVEDMDYITQDEIGVKVDSINITDDTFKANVSFKLNQEFDYRTFSYGYAVYDENNNIYQVFSRMHIGENEKYDYNYIFLNREISGKNSKDIYDNCLSDRAGINKIEQNESEKTITTQINMEAKEKYPQSKKLYIKIFDLGYFTADKDENGEMSAENFNLSDAKWLFEFDVPEEMNQRNTVNLKLNAENEIPNLEIKSITLTESKLVINFKSKEYVDFIMAGKDMESNEFHTKCDEMLNVTDEEGNKYQDLGGGTTGEENGYKISFNATKNDLSKKLFLNFKIGDTQYKSELISE